MSRGNLAARQRAYNAGGRGVRLTVTLSPVAADMLRQLHETGLYGLAGHGVAGVAQEFIYKELRENMRSERSGVRSRSKELGARLKDRPPVRYGRVLVNDSDMDG